MRAEWRSVWKGSGGLRATVGGDRRRQWLCAARVDIMEWVGELHAIIPVCIVTLGRI